MYEFSVSLEWEAVRPLLVGGQRSRLEVSDAVLASGVGIRLSEAVVVVAA